jgi:hypothetical protein
MKGLVSYFVGILNEVLVKVEVRIKYIVYYHITIALLIRHGAKGTVASRKAKWRATVDGTPITMG